MKKPIFTGVATALVTPFRDGGIDYPALEALIDRQIRAGVETLVVAGTTGEAATLTDGERRELFKTAREMTRGRAKLILGTGSADTRRAIEYTRLAERVGADGALVVTPYYNKGTSEGMYLHFKSIAAATDMPIILYNVPSRTGVSLEVSTLTRLMKLPNVLGLKEAAESGARLAEVSRLTGELPLYAGSDALTYTVLSLGGVGVISVVSNIYPEVMVELCKEFFTGNRKRALEIQHGVADVISALFLETNPAPVKYAMAKKGLCSSEMRLPMWLPTERCQRQIDRVIDEFEAKQE